MLLCHGRVRMDSVARTAKNGHTDILTLKRYYSVWRRRDFDIIIWIWYKFCALLPGGPESKPRRFPQSGGGAFSMCVEAVRYVRV